MFYESDVENEINQAVSKFFASLGWDKSEVNDYTRVTIEYNEAIKCYFIRVYAEAAYDEITMLANELDPIVEKYDPDAYFEPEAPGILVAAIWE